MLQDESRADLGWAVGKNWLCLLHVIAFMSGSGTRVMFVASTGSRVRVLTGFIAWCIPALTQAAQPSRQRIHLTHTYYQSGVHTCRNLQVWLFILSARAHYADRQCLHQRVITVHDNEHLAIRCARRSISAGWLEPPAPECSLLESWRTLSPGLKRDVLSASSTMPAMSPPRICDREDSSHRGSGLGDSGSW